MSSNADRNVCFAVVTSVIGVKGYVRVRTFTESPYDIEKFDLFDPKTSAHYRFSVLEVKKDCVIAKVEGINNRTEAEKLRNVNLCVKRSALAPLPKDEYYHSDLIGLDVYDVDGYSVGVVKNVLNFGAGDILDINEIAADKSVYYPFIKQFISSIDLRSRRIVVNSLEELVHVDSNPQQQDGVA